MNHGILCGIVCACTTGRPWDAGRIQEIDLPSHGPICHTYERNCSHVAPNKKMRNDGAGFVECAARRSPDLAETAD